MVDPGLSRGTLTMRRILTALTLVFLVFPAWAQSQLDFDMCKAKGDPDASIGGCTTLIEKGVTDPPVYKERALAHFAKGQYDQAVADFTVVITRDSKDHSNYALRGWAYEKNGQSTQAIADYRAAIKLNPRNSEIAKAARSRLEGLGVKP